MANNLVTALVAAACVALMILGGIIAHRAKKSMPTCDTCTQKTKTTVKLWLGRLLLILSLVVLIATFITIAKSEIDD